MWHCHSCSIFSYQYPLRFLKPSHCFMSWLVPVLACCLISRHRLGHALCSTTIVRLLALETNLSPNVSTVLVLLFASLFWSPVLLEFKELKGTPTHWKQEVQFNLLPQMLGYTHPPLHRQVQPQPEPTKQSHWRREHTTTHQGQSSMSSWTTQTSS